MLLFSYITILREIHFAILTTLIDFGRKFERDTIDNTLFPQVTIKKKNKKEGKIKSPSLFGTRRNPNSTPPLDDSHGMNSNNVSSLV